MLDMELCFKFYKLTVGGSDELDNVNTIEQAKMKNSVKIF